MARSDPPNSDVERLYGAAQHHLRAANEKLSSSDWRIRLDAATHAGAAVEFMAKAVLASIDQRLIHPEHHSVKGFVNLLIESGTLTATPFELTSARTISADEALTILTRIDHVLRSHCGPAKTALKARNSAVHLAKVDEASLADVITAGSDFVLAGVDRLGRDRTAFLGDPLAERVQHEVSERRAALVALTRREVENARLRFAALTGLDGGPREVIMTQLRERRPTRPDITEAHDCPACGSRGWLVWNVDVDEGPEPGSFTPYLDFLGFRCYFCNLSLRHEECEAIGLHPHGDPADHFSDESR